MSMAHPGCMVDVWSMVHLLSMVQDEDGTMWKLNGMSFWYSDDIIPSMLCELWLLVFVLDSITPRMIEGVWLLAPFLDNRCSNMLCELWLLAFLHNIPPSMICKLWLLAPFLDNRLSSMLCELWLLTVAKHISQHDLLAVVVVCTCTRSCQPWSCSIWLCKSTRSDVFQGCFGGVTTHRLILPVFGETLDQFDEACGLLTEMSGGATGRSNDQRIGNDRLGNTVMGDGGAHGNQVPNIASFGHHNKYKQHLSHHSTYNYVIYYHGIGAD